MGLEHKSASAVEDDTVMDADAPLRRLSQQKSLTLSSYKKRSKLLTRLPDQSRQHEPHLTSFMPNNDSLLDLSESLKERPAASTAGNGCGYSKPALPTCSLIKHTSKYKPWGNSRLLGLPLDVFCLITDHLDVVARVCLEYAHSASGDRSKDDFSNLSLCAKSAIVSLLLRDGTSLPEGLLGVKPKGTDEGHCSKYHKIVPKYCVVCRCYGHLSRCPSCLVRTCAREGT